MCGGVRGGGRETEVVLFPRFLLFPLVFYSCLSGGGNVGEV